MITSSPSPTVSSRAPNTSLPSNSPYRSPRAFAGASPSSRRQPSTAIASQSTPVNISSPSRPSYSNAGTQYTPPGSPPTSARRRIHTFTVPAAQPVSQTTQPATIPDDPASAVPPPTDPADTAGSPEPPPEPRLRVTPQSSLQNVGVTPTRVRRSRSSASADDVKSADQPAGSGRSSSPKRARQQGETVKVMPADYSQCEAKHLAALIADMLMELIRFNDEIPLRDGQLTRFHSRAPPGISVHDYLQRLTFHATLPPPILLSMVYYIDRLCGLYRSFTINSLTVHRFLITAATVASKGLSDSFWTNSLYARVGGVSIKELALLELELLTRVRWRIVPQPEELEAYYRSLVRRSGEYVIDGDDEEEEQESTDAATEEENEDSEIAAVEAGSERGGEDIATASAHEPEKSKKSSGASKSAKRRSGTRLGGSKGKGKARPRSGDGDGDGAADDPMDVTMSN